MNLPRQWLLRALDLETAGDRTPDELARQAVAAFQEALGDVWTEDADPEAARAALEAYAARLAKIAPGAPTLSGWLRRCVDALPLGREAALVEAGAVLAGAAGARAALIEVGRTVLPPGARVLVLGHSEVLTELLLAGGDLLELVTVSEGRPRRQGVRTAAALAERALPARLITESQLDLAAAGANLALAAAERVLPDGSVVAPAGTAVLARVAAAHHVPLYVLAERAVWVPERDPAARFAPERRPPSEVHPEPIPGVQVENFASDCTPPDLVTGYVTEDGVKRRP